MMVRLAYLVMILISLTSCATPVVVQRQIDIVDWPILEPYTDQEQRLISFCIGHHPKAADKFGLDCLSKSHDGRELLKKMARNVSRLKQTYKAQKAIIESHNALSK